MSSGLDLDAYLARTGAARPLAPGREALAALHRAHVAAIPFENLDVLLGRPILLDRPRTHMLLRVDLPEGPFLADVGFGGDGLVEPLPLAESAQTWVGPCGHRLRREGEGWVLEGNTGGAWTDLYAFTLEPHHPVDFVMANHFTSTFSRSPFLLNLIAQRSWPERRAILRNRDLVVREGGASASTTIRDPEHLLEVLADVFSLVFPAGTRFPRPEF